MKVELLYVDGCPNRNVATADEAERFGFTGSPTVQPFVTVLS